MQTSTEQLSTPQRETVRRSAARLAVTWGFGVVIALLVLLMIIALVQMTRLSEGLERIAEEHNVKADLVFSMRNIVQERSLSVFALSATDDAFAADDEHMRFRSLAGEFIEMREHLEALPLSDQEQALLSQAKELIRTTAPLQELIVERMVDGDRAGASKLIRRDVRLEQELLRIFDRLVDVQRAAISTATREATTEYLYALRTVVGLGMSTVILALATMVVVVRRTSRIESELFEEKELAQVTLRAIGDAVITTDKLGRVSYLNPVAEHLTGWTNAKARAKPLAEVYVTLSEDSREPIVHPAYAVTLDALAVPPHRHSLLINRRGEEYIIEDKVSPIRSRGGDPVGSVVVFRDVSEAKSFERQLSYQARHDALTGLANRREFELRLSELLADAHANQTQHALLYLDLDQFKVVNDACGHSAGDDLLRQLSVQLEAKIRKSDTIARLGGDEFGLLLPGCSLVRARNIAETLRQTVEDFRFPHRDRVFRVGVSVGVVSIDASSVDLSSVMAAADSACYVAKDRGRNRVWVNQPGDTGISERRSELQWVAQLQDALNEGRFKLHSQWAHPITEHSSGWTYRELLLRMVSQAGELIAPTVFVPAAERYQAMVEIDRWVLREVVDILGAHRPGEREVYAINLSAQSLTNEKFLEQALRMLRDKHAISEHLCFEITETAAISNLKQALSFIDEMQALGCQFAIDDFGSGMTSFPYLRQLPVQFVKIDGGIVRDMASDPIDRTMVETINKIAHELGMLTIAEFVESERVLDHARNIGIDYVQGFLFDQPLEWPGTEHDSTTQWRGSAATERPGA